MKFNEYKKKLLELYKYYDDADDEDILNIKLADGFFLVMGSGYFPGIYPEAITFSTHTGDIIITWLVPDDMIGENLCPTSKNNKGKYITFGKFYNKHKDIFPDEEHLELLIEEKMLKDV